jgi:hypothetical protein
MAKRRGGGPSRDQHRLDRFNRQLSVVAKLSRLASVGWLIGAIVGFSFGNVALGVIGLLMAAVMIYLSRF